MEIGVRFRAVRAPLEQPIDYRPESGGILVIVNERLTLNEIAAAFTAFGTMLMNTSWHPCDGHAGPYGTRFELCTQLDPVVVREIGGVYVYQVRRDLDIDVALRKIMEACTRVTDGGWLPGDEARNQVVA